MIKRNNIIELVGKQAPFILPAMLLVLIYMMVWIPYGYSVWTNILVGAVGATNIFLILCMGYYWNHLK